MPVSLLESYLSDHLKAQIFEVELLEKNLINTHTEHASGSHMLSVSDSKAKESSFDVGKKLEQLRAAIQQNLFVEISLALEEGNSTKVKAILQSKYCTEGLLNTPDRFNITLFQKLALSNKDFTKSVMLSPACSEQILLNYTKDLGGAILLKAIQDNDDGLVSSILKSPGCNEEFLMFKDISGRTALLLAQEKGKLDVFSKILNTPSCSLEVLKIQNKDGETVLSLAHEKKQWKIIEALIDSNKCSKEYILSSIKEDKNSVLWSAICANQDELACKIIQSSASSSELLAHENILNISVWYHLVPSRNMLVMQEILAFSIF